ncbi:hypothetical protein [Alloalcanivorax xenomutans]|uniref:hypothetical protein n=1 Tax=Alloalcanivorax xenomutans TaxID=1094342 RepID=UPI003BAA2827
MDDPAEGRLMGFGADVSRITQQASQALSNTVADVEIQVMTLIILRSPVDSGRFRGNWQASAGAPEMGGLDRLGAQASIEAMESVVRALKGGRVTYMANNLPYGPRLEYDGWSGQAPEGMVRKTAAQFQQIVQASAQKYRL